MNRKPELKPYAIQWRLAQVVVAVFTLALGLVAFLIFGLTAGSVAVEAYFYLAALAMTVVTLTTFYVTIRIFSGRPLDPERLYESVEVSREKSKVAMERRPEMVPAVMLSILHITEVITLVAAAIVLVGTAALLGLGFRASVVFGPEIVAVAILALVVIAVFAWRSVLAGFQFLRRAITGDQILNFAQKAEWSKHHA